MGRKKVAIVGSGCSGIGALWALKRTEHEVHLYESNTRLGGHTNTVPFKSGSKEVQVDTGFIVMNSVTYPNFLRFLDIIGVHTKPTEMTFGVSRDRGLFEWSGTSLAAVFGQKSNLFRLGMWQMIFDIIRFNQFALDLLSSETESEVDPSGADDSPSTTSSAKTVKVPKLQSIGDYLDENHYSDAFRNDYLIPMTACVWSTHPDKVSLDFPALTLVRFLWNHHLLNTITARPSWMTIPGGTKRYIDAVMADFPYDQVHMQSRVISLYNRDNKVVLCLENGKEEHFDHVILATHGDTAKSIIEESATPSELDIMSSFHTSANTAVLHADLALMPTRPAVWSSWNYITRTPGPGQPPSTVCLTYSMNILQHIPSSVYGPVLVTLNPLKKPSPALTQGSWAYNHPQYNASAVRAQQLLPSIQNKRQVSYCGAWTKYGFHEDGFSSGLKVAVEHLGAKLPFEFVDSTFSRGRRPLLGWKDHTLRFVIRVIQFWIVLAKLALAIMFGQGKRQDGLKTPNGSANSVHQKTH